MTGRGVGYCAGYDIPGYADLGPDFSRGRGGRGPGMRGSGRGWRHWRYATGLPGRAHGGYPRARDYGPYGPPLTEARETEMLKGQAEVLKRELEAITTRLEELGKDE